MFSVLDELSFVVVYSSAIRLVLGRLNNLQRQWQRAQWLCFCVLTLRSFLCHSSEKNNEKLPHSAYSRVRQLLQPIHIDNMI